MNQQKEQRNKKRVESPTVHALENEFCLPIGTLAPVAKWQSCLLRINIEQKDQRN